MQSTGHVQVAYSQYAQNKWTMSKFEDVSSLMVVRTVVNWLQAHTYILVPGVHRETVTHSRQSLEEGHLT